MGLAFRRRVVRMQWNQREVGSFAAMPSTRDLEHVVIRRSGGLEQRARLGEGEPRQARMQRVRITVTEVAQEIRLDVTLREELLIAAEARFAGGEELLVHLRLIEAGHRPAIEA